MGSFKGNGWEFFFNKNIYLEGTCWIHPTSPHKIGFVANIWKVIVSVILS